LDESGDFEEAKLNEFLENVSVNQVFASVVNNEFWSVLAFYEEGSAPDRKTSQPESMVERPESFSPEKISEPKESVPEPIILNSEEEAIYNTLRQWRSERANQDGLPPYMIAHNDSLMQMAKIGIMNKDELLQIKGFGEKKVEKYGDEILEILRGKI
jgi:superfamily II DNA helicase RecQ